MAQVGYKAPQLPRHMQDPGLADDTRGSAASCALFIYVRNTFTFCCAPYNHTVDHCLNSAAKLAGPYS